MSTEYVRWNDPQVEPPVQDEAGKIQGVCDLINRMQDHNFSKHRHAFRGTHVKTQAIVKGSMEILPDLPPHLAQGLFSNGGKTLPVGMRYANEPTFLQDDRAPGPRGAGMKVFNVPSSSEGYLDPIGESTHTQDFTFNNAPILELTDLPTTLEIIGLREKNFDDGETLRAELKKRKDSELQFAPAGLPNNHFMAYTMYSQSAYRFGDYVVKYALFPTSKLQQDLAEKFKVNDSSDPEQHSIWLRKYFQEHDAEFDFRVQLCRDLSQQSVEDCSQLWSEEKFPFETVAKVTFPAGQDVFDAKRRAFWDDHMKLNVWYGLKAHQPLGSANRLRKALYKASSKKREEMNAAEILAPKSIDEIP